MLLLQQVSGHLFQNIMISMLPKFYIARQRQNTALCWAPAAHLVPGAGGSYGINRWIFDTRGFSGSSSWPFSWRWKRTLNVKHADRIPILTDSIVDGQQPLDNDAPPDYEGDDDLWPKKQIGRVCLNRHTGYVNSVFMDWSVRKVGLKELWTLKWHRKFNTNGQWTKAGGVQPANWPKWMRKFKDY